MNPDTDRTHRKMNQVALTLLAYPIMYICLTLTLSITRLSEFAGDDWGFTCVYVGASIFCCSGWVNVLMYTVTRKGIISWDWLFGRRSRARSNSAHLTSHPRSESRVANPEYEFSSVKGSGLSQYSNSHFPGGQRIGSSDVDLSISKPGSCHSGLGGRALSDEESVCATIEGDEKKLVHERNCPVRNSFATDTSCNCLLTKSQR